MRCENLIGRLSIDTKDGRQMVYKALSFMAALDVCQKVVAEDNGLVETMVFAFEPVDMLALASSRPAAAPPKGDVR